jgi:hypothetical protein
LLKNLQNGWVNQSPLGWGDELQKDEIVKSKTYSIKLNEVKVIILVYRLNWTG